MEHRREIDGLRAIAVIPVIFFHAGFELFSGGFVGVDIFFVISGYLITSIIIQDLSAGKFSLKVFYKRRARRILPALFFILFVSTIAAWHLLLPTELIAFSKSVIATILFASNFLFWKESGYFDTASELKPLLHTWSLAVEEQYYIIFPVFMMMVWRLGKTRILISLAIVAILSFSLAEWASTAKPSSAFYLLPTRSWEILVGALVAFYASTSQTKIHPSLRAALSLSGLILIGFSIASYQKNTPFPGVHALAPTLGAAAIIAFGDKNTITGKLLGNKIFVAIGLTSYSAYLWHQPIFAFARAHMSVEVPKNAYLGLTALTFFAAYISYRFIEQPFRKNSSQPIFSITNKTIIGTAGFSFIILFASASIYKEGFKSRVPIIPQNPELVLPSRENGYCFYSIDTTPTLQVGSSGLNCSIGDLKSSKRALLFGDSFAGHYEPVWGLAGEKLKLKIDSITTNWCYPSLADNFTGPRDSRALAQCLINRKFLRENISKYDLIIFSANWRAMYEQGLMSELQDVIEYAQQNAPLTVIMPAPKKFDIDPLNEYRKSAWRNHQFDINTISTKKDIENQKAHTSLRDLADKYNNIIFVERSALFDYKNNHADVTGDGLPYSLDGGHLSLYGSKSAALNFIQSTAFNRIDSYLRK